MRAPPSTDTEPRFSTVIPKDQAPLSYSGINLQPKDDP